MKKIFLFPFILCAVIQLSAQKRNISSNNVSIIDFATSGKVWISTPGNGCAVFEPSDSSLSDFNSSNTIMLSDTVTAIALFSISGTPYSFMATTNGVYYRVDTTWTSLPNLPNANVTGITKSPDNKLYISTAVGVSVYDADTIALTHITDINTGNSTLPFTTISTMQLQPTACDGYYAGTPDSGYFYTSDDSTFTVVNTTDSNLVNNHVNVILVNSSCSIRYIGTQGGLTIDSLGVFNNLTTANGLHENNVTAVAVDCKGQTWIGTHDSGIAIYNGSTFTYLNTASGILNSNNIRSINVNPSNCDIWIGTVDSGLIVLDTLFNVQHFFTGVNEVQLDNTMAKVFPQPASDILNFSFGQQILNGELSLYDMNGKRILNYNISNTTSLSLDVSNFQQGIYFYSVRDEKNAYSSGKIAIIR